MVELGHDVSFIHDYDLLFVFDDKLLVDEFHGVHSAVFLLLNEVNSGEASEADAFNEIEVFEIDLLVVWVDGGAEIEEYWFDGEGGVVEYIEVFFVEREVIGEGDIFVGGLEAYYLVMGFFGPLVLEDILFKEFDLIFEVV